MAMHQDKDEREPCTWGLSLKQFFALKDYGVSLNNELTQPDVREDLKGSTVNVTDAGIFESLTNAGLHASIVEEIALHEGDDIVVMLEGEIHVCTVIKDYLHRFEPTYELEDEEDTD